MPVKKNARVGQGVDCRTRRPLIPIGAQSICAERIQQDEENVEIFALVEILDLRNVTEWSRVAAAYLEL